EAKEVVRRRAIVPADRGPPYRPVFLRGTLRARARDAMNAGSRPARRGALAAVRQAVVASRGRRRSSAHAGRSSPTRTGGGGHVPLLQSHHLLLHPHLLHHLHLQLQLRMRKERAPTALGFCRAWQIQNDRPDQNKRGSAHAATPSESRSASGQRRTWNSINLL